METTKAALMTILMLTVALAGCMGDDTSELDARISELEQSNMELEESLATAQGESAQPVSYTHLTLPTSDLV